MGVGFTLSGLPKILFGGVGPPWSPFPPPRPPGTGLQRPALLFHVFHAYSMTKPLALSQSVAVTVTVSLKGGAQPTVVSHSNTPPPPQLASWSKKFQTFVLRKSACGPWSPFSHTPFPPEFGGGSKGPPSKIWTSPVLSVRLADNKCQTVTTLGAGLGRSTGRRCGIHVLTSAAARSSRVGVCVCVVRLEPARFGLLPARPADLEPTTSRRNRVWPLPPGCSRQNPANGQ